MNITTEDRFWRHVNIGNENDCWNWNASGIPTGYGTFTVDKKKKYAHRYSFELHNRVLQKGEVVGHHCDNPACCNPKHLFLTTHTGNMQDMVKKGRSKNQKKTHCKNGHEFTAENTYRWVKNPRRVCKACSSKYWKNAK